MQEVVERVRAVVAAFEPKRTDPQIDRIEQLALAIGECRDYIEKNEKDDRGCAQRLAREIDEILSGLPHFRHLGNKQDAAARHTKRLAEDHLLDIQKQLQDLVEADKKSKARELRDWVNKHKVFGPLRRMCIKKGLPKDAFVLLFEKNADGEFELMPRSVEENSVLTRFRPTTFIDDVRVHQQFSTKPTIVGAALIADNKLVETAGEVPPPTENRDQLQILLFYSNEVASGPAKQFVESNEVLKTLHELSRKKGIPKDAYVLLFRKAEEEQQQADEETPHEEEPVAEVAEEEAPAAVEEETPPAVEEETPPVEETPQEEPVAEVPQEETPAAETPAEQPDIPLEIVDKTMPDGKVITRFWSNDFVRKHHLFDMFRDGAPLVGAAVIRERELLNAIGILPKKKKNQSQLDAILSLSNKAVQRPSIEFVAQHEVLNALNQLANAPGNKEAFVLLFTRTETSPYALMPGKFGPRVPLDDFKQARIIHQRYGEGQTQVTGAAVISEGAKPFVSAAFGRSPLKQSMLAVPENFRRLGLPVELIEPPRRPHFKDSKGRPNRRPKDRQDRGERQGSKGKPDNR